KAFDFISHKDLLNIENGTFQIAEGLKLIVSNGHGKTKEASLEKFECHDKNIDIQICVNGIETIAWKPREKCEIPNGDYNSEKDVRFYNDVPDMYFQLTNNQFAIFYPEDVHAPMIGNGEIKKLVFKVKI
ncbi:MAG TPA: YhcH/YjgK/YiaL family protein, partial [Gillisia sp.]|nr:YhcH/YjgK/YiaL family protein [Gillisia sp.]